MTGGISSKTKWALLPWLTPSARRLSKGGLRTTSGGPPAPGARAVSRTLVAWYRSFTHLAREGRMTVTIGRRELLAALGGTAGEGAAPAPAPHAPVPLL